MDRYDLFFILLCIVIILTSVLYLADAAHRGCQPMTVTMTISDEARQ